ncbi:HIT family protein [Marinobacter antarcticus]|uniref:HIT family protein n=1 Tax=Marinobacter antarcticus TaxID=564117 RepID=UPI002B400122|nr:HIT family protein [Marinobacter antarcticus]
MMTSKECPFCNLPSERIIHESIDGFVIRDGYPISPGHTLIIPKEHYSDFFCMPGNIRQDLMSLIDTAKTRLDVELEPNGYNVGINNGPAAGQTVPHLHIHLIPRFEGDQNDPRGGVRWIFPERARYWV